MHGPVLAVTPPVGTADPRREEWAELADELAPAKSLQRLDAVAARVVSTVSVVATLLTGLGLVAAGLANLTVAARVLAVGAVVLAFGDRARAGRPDPRRIPRLNRENLAEVEAGTCSGSRTGLRAPRWATYPAGGRDGVGRGGGGGDARRWGGRADTGRDPDQLGRGS